MQLKKDTIIWKNPKLIIKDTKIYGLGVFAGENIDKGEKIKNLSGKRVAAEEIINKIKKGDEAIDDPLQIGKRLYIDLDDLSRIFNHSCNPNAAIRKNNELFAIKNIRKGLEITYDYSATIEPTTWRMKCKCGSKNCRKIIGDIATLSTEKINTYQKKGAFQNHILALLKQSKTGNKYSFFIPKFELEFLKKIK
jgi:uncharacterized protein